MGIRKLKPSVLSGNNILGTLSAQFGEIWTFIEERMRMEIPSYIKQVLHHCGYDNYYSIASIEETDFDYFTNEIQKGRLRAKAAFANTARTVEDFEFTRGHQRLVMAFVKFVRTILDTSGIDGFSVPIVKAKAKINTKKENLALRKPQPLPIFTPPTINQENNCTIKKAEDCFDIEEKDCSFDSSALTQSDSSNIGHSVFFQTPMQESSTQMALTTVSFPFTYVGVCSSHAVSRIASELLDEMEYSKIRKLDFIGALTTLTTSVTDVSTSAVHKEALNRETNELLKSEFTPQAEEYVIYASSKESLAKWPESTPNVKYFVAKILSVNDEVDDEVKLQFLDRSRYSKFKFRRPKENDVRMVARNEIIKVLEAPTSNRRSELVFSDISLLNYNFENESYKIINKYKKSYYK